jgi:DNA-binding transcriptional ArsR family regulator/uncharacterized metal-binding protein
MLFFTLENCEGI